MMDQRTMSGQDSAHDPPTPKPRRAGQKIRRGERKWTLITFAGRDAQGRRHYRRETFLGTAKAADTRLRQLLERKDGGQGKKFLNDYLDEWLAGQLEISKRTLADYSALMQTYVRSRLGLYRLADIRAEEIRKLYRGLMDQGLSARTIRYIHTVLSKALKEAESLDANPCSKVKLPKLVKPKPRFLLGDEVRRFLKAAQGDRLQALFAVAVDGGLRPSEQLGLRWQDVNLESGSISVQHGLKWNRKGGGYELGELKTTNSKRCIKLASSTLQILGKHRIAQHEERLALGSEYENNNFVFATTIGTPLEPRNVIGRHFKPILRRGELPDIRWYDLRHTMASLLLAQGINPKIVAERLGDSVEITLSVYSHLIPSMQNDAALALEKAFAG